MFTTIDVEISKYEKLSKEVSAQFLIEYLDSRQIEKLKKLERIHLIKKALDENILVYVEQLWKAHKHMFGNGLPVRATKEKKQTTQDPQRSLHCAENLLCHIRMQIKKDTSVLRFD